MRMFFMLAMATIAHGQVVDIINIPCRYGGAREIRIR